MIIRIAVCDDEEIAVKIITDALKEQFLIHSVSCEIEQFLSSDALAEKINSGSKYDILFADISMPGTNGILLGTMLHRKMPEALLIYISSREDLVFETFQAQPFRFIRKKKFHEELPSHISAICSEIMRRQKQKLPFRCKTSTVMLDPEKIVFVESYKKIQIIHYENQQFEIQSSLQNIMKKLEQYPFIQIHKSYYVNCCYIYSINRYSLELDDHTRLPVGRSRLNHVKNEFQKYTMQYLQL